MCTGKAHACAVFTCSHIPVSSAFLLQRWCCHASCCLGFIPWIRFGWRCAHRWAEVKKMRPKMQHVTVKFLPTAFKHSLEKPWFLWFNEKKGQPQSNQTINFLLQGFIMKLPIWGQPPDQNCFDDSIYWEVRNPISHKYYRQLLSNVTQDGCSSTTLFRLLHERFGEYIRRVRCGSFHHYYYDLSGLHFF